MGGAPKKSLAETPPAPPDLTPALPLTNCHEFPEADGCCFVGTVVVSAPQRTPAPMISPPLPPFPSPVQLPEAAGAAKLDTAAPAAAADMAVDKCSGRLLMSWLLRRKSPLEPRRTRQSQHGTRLRGRSAEYLRCRTPPACPRKLWCK